MTSRLTRSIAAACLVALAACAGDATSPSTAARLPVADASPLFAEGEGSYRLIADYYDGPNHILEAEVGAGLLGLEYQASVYIKTSIPPVPAGAFGSALPCITNSIMKIETRPGWTATVRKPGGCGKDIQVEISNAQKQRATFTWRFTWGLTKVDHGAVR